VTRGEPRSVRSTRPRCRFLLLAQVARPRYRIDRATTSRRSLRRALMNLVAIDVHGSLDRAKDASSSVESAFWASPGRVHTLCACRRRSPPRRPEGTCCRRCDRLHGNEPRTDETDRPRPTLLRKPAKAAGIPWIRVPSTVAPTDARGDRSTRCPRRPSRSRRPHVSPWLGTSALDGHCKASLAGSTASDVSHL
jgi:hypothetical protein